MAVSAIERATQWNKEHPERRRATVNKYTRGPRGYLNKRRSVVARHGLTLNQYEQMWLDQGGCCAVCNLPETAQKRNGTTCHLAVDHCHTTNKIRALLCDRCNRALGVVQDDKMLLNNLLWYLETHLGHE